MGFLASLLAGPVFGMVGSWVNSWIAHKGKQLEIEDKKLDRLHEKDLLTIRFKAQEDDREDEKWITSLATQSAMRTASYAQDASYGPVDPKNAVALRWVRPVLTFTLVILAAIIYGTVADGAVISIDGEMMTIRDRCVMSILFLAESAVTWWFGDAVRRSK